MDFVPITTQEDLNKVISERLTREREATAKKYGDYDELKSKVGDYEKQLADYAGQLKAAGEKQAAHDQTVAELEAKIRGYETDSAKTRIALETGLPYELASRLSGETEDDIRKDAQKLVEIVHKGSGSPQPKRSTEPSGTDKKTAALRAFTESLTSKGD
ncbi:MAG: DUF4355 domain-containing protein [Oscillospiraceae bacterium]|nr:DUF4355 domain-containing protein [Oscillospiraceae bacterium]